MVLHSFTYNPFAENTYVIADDDDQTCTIIDPGCFEDIEIQEFTGWIKEAGLQPDKIVLTHAHLDHIFGLERCLQDYEVPFYMHDLERPILKSAPAVGGMYGLSIQPVSRDHHALQESDEIEMGGTKWTCILVPGHSPGSLCFYSAEEAVLIGGDVLFRESIGRTDLPGGDHEALLSGIRDKIYRLPNETAVYPGHGPTTTIGHERSNNPFVRMV